MWKYEQSTGILRDKTGHVITKGYSGRDQGKNNPFLQDLHNLGPIPRGFYEIGEPFDSHDHGPFCLRLTPFPENEMFGRDGFLMHGDSIPNPGHASEGCIIAGREYRTQVHASGDKILEVVK